MKSMKVKIFSLITAFLIGFSSLSLPIFSVTALAQQAVIPWAPIFRFIGETLGAYFIDKGADYAVNQLTGSGRKMTDDEYNATSKDWDACVSYMKSQGCTDSDIENLQAQIQGGDLDLSSKVGQAMQNFFAQKGANIVGSWHNFLTPIENNISKVITRDEQLQIMNSYFSSQKYHDGYIYKPVNASWHWYNDLPVNCCAVVCATDIDIEGYRSSFMFTYVPDKKGNVNLSNYYKAFQFRGLSSSDYPTNSSAFDVTSYHYDNVVVYSDVTVLGHLADGSKPYVTNQIISSNGSGSMPVRISAYGGSVPHYFDNTIDNDDSSKNTYNNIPASIDWSDIFDSDDDKNPTFKKIDGYTPPEPKIKKNGSNYDDVVKQLQEANRKLAKILGWLEDFDYDNNGKIKDHRLGPIQPNTPLFNFKLSEKFPFSLPWDMLAILSILRAKPVAPKYEFPIMLPDESGKVKPIKLSDDRIGVIQGDKIVLDFTSQDWQDTAKILRWGELVLFICGLCVVFWKYGK